MYFNIVKALIATVIIGVIMFVYMFIKNNNKGLMSERDFKKYMDNLMHDEDNVRFEAIDQIKQLKPNKARAISMIRLASQRYPKARYEWEDISGILIDVATSKPDQALVMEIKGVFPSLNAKAKSSSLGFLQKYGTKESIEVYADLLVNHYKELDTLPTNELEKDPKHEKILFPKISECVDNGRISYDLYLLTLKYLEKGLIRIDKDEKLINRLVLECRNNREDIERIQGPKGKNDWIWDNDSYLNLRYKQGIILDLLGFVKNQDSIGELEKGLRYHDNKLKYFSIISLLIHSMEVTNTDTESVACDPEMRNWLFDGLKKHNRMDLFPDKYYNQAALAESNMVEWLTYPTELGRVPDEIELVKVMAEDTKTSDGVIEFYLFRFRSNHPDWADNGWMVGLAGPFLTKDGPNTDAYGYTFSAFEKWEDKSVDEHIAKITGLIDEWRAKSR